jgi:tetratricopeptide (TPR) repeat protein
MSTKAVQGNAAEKVTVSQKLNDFITKFRVAIIAIVAVVVIAVAAILLVSVVTEGNSRKAFESVDKALADWDAARTAADKTGLAAKEDELIVSLKKVAASSGKTYAAAHALNTVAEIYYSRKDWKNAEEQYLAAAKAAPKAFSCGINYYNAASCADELGNADDALAYFNKALALENFSMKPRALFSIGRIEEQRSKKAEAIAAYEKLASQYPDDDWTLLAKSRIIALQIQK